MLGLSWRRGESRQESTDNRQQTITHTNGHDQTMPEPPERAADAQPLGDRKGTHVAGPDTASTSGMHPKRNQHEGRKQHCHKHHTCLRQESLSTAKGPTLDVKYVTAPNQIRVFSH
eukprot:4495866-Pleurochrysis_carterae.AAC.1